MGSITMFVGLDPSVSARILLRWAWLHITVMSSCHHVIMSRDTDLSSTELPPGPRILGRNISISSPWGTRTLLATPGSRSRSRLTFSWKGVEIGDDRGLQCDNIWGS